MWRNAYFPPENSISEYLGYICFPRFLETCKCNTNFQKRWQKIVNNYRPISLLPICGKIFEKLVFNHVYGYLNSNNLLTVNQSGFRPGDSTTNQLLYLVNEIHEAFENPKCLEMCAVFLDISKGFDKVWHEGLVFKLKQNGITGTF